MDKSTKNAVPDNAYSLLQKMCTYFCVYYCFRARVGFVFMFVNTVQCAYAGSAFVLFVVCTYTGSACVLFVVRAYAGRACVLLVLCAYAGSACGLFVQCVYMQLVRVCCL